MKPHGLDWEQINPDPESEYLHSKRVVRFVLFSVKNQARICETVSNHKASFRS